MADSASEVNARAARGRVCFQRSTGLTRFGTGRRSFRRRPWRGRGCTMNLQWAKRWLQEFTPEGIAKTMSMYAEEVDFEDVTLGHRESTAAGIQKFFTGFSKGPSQHRFEVTHWAGDDKGGAMEWTWHSKHETEIFGVQAKGK